MATSLGAPHILAARQDRARSRPPLGPIRRTVREVGLALITGGVVVLAFVAYQLFGTAIAEQHSQSVLQKSFNAAVSASGHRSPPAHKASGGAKPRGSGHSGGGHIGSSGGKPAKGGDNPTVGSVAPVTPSSPAGIAVDHLVIPKIGVNKYVVQGTADSDLSEGPGHYIGTPLPGEKGNAAIAGHRTTYGAPFFRLNQVAKGDLIYVTSTKGKTFDYRVVRSEVVSPNDVAVLDNTKNAELTLTTCNPPYSATSRLVVVADLIGKPVATPATAKGTTAKGTTAKGSGGRAGATTATTASPGSPASGSPASGSAAADSDNLGLGNSNAWTPALAFGAGFVVLWILTRLAINRTRKWSRLAAFVVGIGLCAVPLWFCFENVVRLLPQNI